MNFILGFAVLKTLKPALLVTVVGFTSALFQWWFLLAFFPPPFIALLTRSLQSTDAVKHHNGSHGLCCWKCPPMPAEPGGRLGKGIFLGGGAESRCS